MFIYYCCAMIALCALISLGVDYGRVQLVKTELQRTADAAARYGATGLATSVTLARTNAKASAAENKADGTSVVLKNSDIDFGTWDSITKKFTANTPTTNAIRVTARRRKADGNAVPLFFAPVVGRSNVDIKAISTVVYTPPTDIVLDVPESSNLGWRACPTAPPPTPIRLRLVRDWTRPAPTPTR